MLTVEIIAPKRRRLTLLWRRRFVLSLPQAWSEVSASDRLTWWRIGISMPELSATHAILRRLIPARWRVGLSDTDTATLVNVLRWAAPKPSCSDIAFPAYRHRRTDFLLPTANGENISCLEFALADDMYTRYAATQDAEQLELLTWTLYRERDTDTAAATARGDNRVLLHGIAEVQERLRIYGPAPVEMQTQALLYMSGLKVYLQQVYGAWIFEQPDEDEDGNPLPQPEATTPNFGWWGIFQAVAESGIFGDMEKTYQSSLHEVCVYLVRKKIESDRIHSFNPSPAHAHDNLH